MTPNQKIATFSLFLAAFLAYSIVGSIENVLIEQSKNETSVALEAERTKQLLGSQDNILKAVEVGITSQQQVDTSQKADEEPKSKEPLDNTANEDNITSKGTDTSNPDNVTSYFKTLSPPSSEDLAVIQQVKEHYPQAAGVFNAMSHGVERLIKSTAQADTVRYNNVLEMSGDMAVKINVKPRVLAEKIIMKDDFRVLKVDSSSTDVRKTLLRSPDGTEFSANFTDGSMGKEKLKKLNEAFWGYHPIDLSIEAKKSQGKIKDALITQVRNVNTKHSFKEDDEQDA